MLSLDSKEFDRSEETIKWLNVEGSEGGKQGGTGNNRGGSEGGGKERREGEFKKEA
jgi:hypothetical protein